MAELYWSCAEGGTDKLLAVLLRHGHRPQLVGEINRTPIFAISNPGSALVKLTAELLHDERIVSAALTARPLPPNELYLAIEWRRRMVVEKSEVAHMVAASEMLLAADGYPPRGLIIFKLRSFSQKSVDPDLRQGKEESIQSVLARREDYYGDLADPEVGGCQSAFKRDPGSASKRDPPEGRVLTSAHPPSELFGRLTIRAAAGSVGM